MEQGAQHSPDRQEVIATCLPQTRPQHRNIPYSKQALLQLDQRRRTLATLQQQFHQARGTPQEQNLYKQVQSYKRAMQQWARRQRAQWIRELCTQLDTAMRLQDMGRFHQLLKQLGVNVTGKTHAGQAPFGLEETTKIVETVGNEPFAMPDHLDQLLPAQCAIQWEFGHPPAEQEIRQALHKMKDTKGGTDNITAGCMRALGPLFQHPVMEHRPLHLGSLHPRSHRGPPFQEQGIPQRTQQLSLHPADQCHIPPPCQSG